MLDNKTLLVTGGTGSFGQRLVRHVLDGYRPRRLIVFSRDELKQYEMEETLADHPNRGCLRFFIGDVRDRDRLELATRETDCIIHAAALKHIPTAEYNPFECIHTNVVGAENVANAAIRNRVSRVIALSTDKAVSPINLYGASKLASDKIFVAANHLSGTDGPRFSVVRYGNVLGSRGSVVPRYRRLIEQGAERLPITDERMTRFWITLRQGVEFVLSSLEGMHGGEIFVPKLPSMRIVDLARAMAPDLPHETTGIRPGEKLHETLIASDDACTTLALSDRYVIEPGFAWWSREPYADAEPVSEDFRYASDCNDHWLDAEALRAMIDDDA